MIEKINIEGFRGINRLDIDGFSKINLLVGRNNCGKTSILEALFLVIGITNPVLARNIHFFRDLVLTQTDDFRFIFYKLDFQSKVKIEAIVKPNQVRTLTIKPKISLSIPENGVNKLSENESKYLSTSSASIENVERLILNSIIATNGNSKPKKFQSEIFFEEGKLEAKIPQSYKESMTGFFVNSDTIYRDLSKRIENILVRKQKNLLLQTLKQIDPKIQDISLGNNGMIYLDIGYNRLIPVNLLGDGIRRILSISAKILDTDNGIVLLDEIENGLHYTSMNVFLKLIIKVAELQNIQLFITTHSRETLITMKKILSQKEFQAFQPYFKSFTVRKHKEDKIVAYPFDYEKVEHAIEQDIEIR